MEPHDCAVRLCVIGNLLGRNPGCITTQGHVVADLLAGEGYPVVSASSKRNRILRMLDILATLMRNRKSIDVVIVEVYSGLAFVLADITGLALRVLKLPSILVLHGGNLPQFTHRNPRWVQRVLQRADLVVAPSRYLAEEMGLGIEAVVVPNVIEIEAYPYRQRENIRPKMLWMRSFHDIYNPDMAVEVLALLKSDFPDATMVMAGADKGIEDRIKHMASSRGLSDSLRFPGFLDHGAKLKEFAEADVYLNTNRIDNMPVSVIEAWAMGVPVVATTVGGLPYLIESERTGMLVADGNAKEMAHAVRTLLNQPGLCARLSMNGRTQAELCSWGVVRNKWADLIGRIGSLPRRPRSNPYIPDREII